MLSKSGLKYIQSLHLKKFRDAEKVFIAEGVKIVPELLQASGIECMQLLATETWLLENAGWLQNTYHGSVTTVLPHEMEKASALQTPSPVLAICKQPHFATPAAAGKFIVLLDDIQDPGNLGTIIRTADWFGVHHIICSPQCADVYGPKTVQSTMGSIARLPVSYMPLADWLTAQQPPLVFAAALQGTNLYQVNPVSAAVLMIGNESKGLQPVLLNRATQHITIPRAGGAESLNAAVAAGILMAQLCRPFG
jgi:RNA methyltransferase, TrmH family